MEVEKYVAHNTGSLVLSSTFFLLPCIYTIYNGMHFFTALLALTSGISANYWRKATYGVRRNLDLWFSKISFVIFVSNQIVYIWVLPPTLFGYPLILNEDTLIENLRYYCSMASFASMVYFYYLSEISYHRGHDHWRTYHFIFHIFVAIEQIIILEAIASKR
jgi:hypothetical protein